MNPFMSRYEAAKVLCRVRARMSEAAFGYLLQGLFAHVLLHLGFGVEEVNPTGHPDIVAVRGSRHIPIEVEVLAQTATTYQFKPEDVGADAFGYLVLVECGEPVTCFCIPLSRAARWVGKALAMPAVRALADRLISEESSNELSRLILANANALETTLSFAVLRRRALRGEVLPTE